ncbi:hypothetical protein HPB52_020337 [Rhipicephalus sanguineus]|uniref:Uncharacterized protein n=1 Tax=Rhipicephalus sanguineus TaxID=34632 RepID=A0A9D4PSH9_RHISA|nr:hypothetical protein HPB52_020337 [Rhipicephalus sanguineus]
MQPLLPRNHNSLFREAHGRDAGRAAADGGDAAAGRAAEGGVADAEEGIVDEDEVERLASWLSLFRMLVIFLPLFALCMPSLLGDWERARRNETSLASRRFMGFITPPGASYRRQSVRTTCRSRACIVAASSISLDPTANPCDDLFGHVCNNWIRDHRLSRARDKAHAKDISKAVGNAYYFTNEPALLRMETRNDTSRPSAAGGPQDAWSSWNLRTIIEEAFEGRETPDEVVVRAPSYVDALPDALKQVKKHELLNYLGLRTALLASRLLPAGPEKQLLCRLIDVDDTAPARNATEHCIRLMAKYEPELALYALTALSPLVTGVDTESLLGFLRRQLSSEIRAGALDLDDPTLADHLADRIYSMPWIGPAPSWLRNVTLREAYFMRFYEGKAAPVGSADTSQAMFAWMQEKAVSEHLATNGPHRTTGDQPWRPGLLSTRCMLALREGEAADSDGVPRPEATLQVCRRNPARGVRAFKAVLEYLFRWQQRQHTDATGPHVLDNCTPWDAAPRQLDIALESRALSLALRAYLAWPGAPELVLPTLLHLEPEQLFYVFYALNQCEVNGPDVEQTLASRSKPRDDGARAGRASWVNRVTARNEDFARAFRCPTPLKPPNPFRDCGLVPHRAPGARTVRT